MAEPQADQQAVATDLGPSKELRTGQDSRSDPAIWRGSRNQPMTSWTDWGLHRWLSANIVFVSIENMLACSGSATAAVDAKWRRIGNSLCLMPRTEVELQPWGMPASKKSPALQEVDAHSCPMKLLRARSWSLLSDASTARPFIDNKLDLCS